MTRDAFPGCGRFCEIALGIVDGVAGDAVRLAFHGEGEALDRAALCELLVRRHNSERNPAQRTANAEWIDVTLDAEQVLPALRDPRGYPDAECWRAWSGLHRGTWFDVRDRFDDNAVWYPPADDDAGSGGASWWPRERVCRQRVDFIHADGSVSHVGWNRSHPDVPFLWGWDPKNMGSEKGMIGTTVGFPFHVADAHGILWMTTKEAFLELARVCSDGVRRRAATGLAGFGQFTIK